MIKSLTFIILILAVFIIPVSAQTIGEATSVIKARLTDGLVINVPSPEINFGEIILNGNNQNIEKSPSQGIRMVVSGSAGRDITINFNRMVLNYLHSDIQLPEDQLLFIPIVEHTGSEIIYSEPIPVQAGSSCTLNNDGSGRGVLNLWIGGVINIEDTQSIGDYSGTFTMTVAY